MLLNRQHIDYILQDMQYRGMIHQGLQEEILDHICASTEIKMKSGKRFIDAYTEVIREFGESTGLLNIQMETFFAENEKTKNMIKNYITIAFRNIRKHSFYSIVNILGLSVGVAVCLIIALFIVNELSYDRHFENAHRIYRIESDIMFGGNHFQMTYSPAPMADALPLEFQEIEAAVHFRERGSYLVKREMDNIREENVIWAGKDFFKVFNIPIIEGNTEHALNMPKTMAVSKRVADKYFPGESAMGQSLILDNQWEFKITVIYEDLPVNSHFHFDFLLAAEGLDEAKNTFWLSNNFQTYFILQEGADPKGLEAKFPGLVEKHIAPALQQVLGSDFTLENFTATGNKIEYKLQPLLDIHLKSDLMGEFEPNFNMTYIYMFGAIALFILLIACINFMNLSTARSANRAREVGIRKVMGSYRSHLVRQFMLESVLMTIFAFIMAIGLAWILMPLFNTLADRQLSLPFSNFTFYSFLITAALLTGILAGTYPAFFLSAFKPVTVLKGNLTLSLKSGIIRATLVVFQFAISIVLIIATIGVYKQLNYIQNKKIGFNKEQVIMVDDTYGLGDQREAYKNEVLKNENIISSTYSGYLPVSGTWRSDNPWWVEGRDPRDQANMVSIQNWYADHDYIKTLGMTIKDGRDFSITFPSDSNAVLLNETAIRSFQFDGDPLGQRIATFAGDPSDDSFSDNLEYLSVIGIVENFHFESLKKNIAPVMIRLSRRPQGYASFRFHSSDVKSIISLLESTWKEMAPNHPFSYYFLDDRFGKMYTSEVRLGRIFAIFTGFAIFIACLGLFALTAFTSEQRSREIGIRKVLGANTASIVVLLSKEFTRLVLIAFILAAPIAWWIVREWLKDYQYRAEISWTLYVMSGLLAILIAWLTMGFQSVKAALQNPVHSLRSE
ncbi:MAG TPA: ABC transporter permease [Saprospiraceae bacterium]|nr:ABC transporter permease [Saprospiraceae bacterium]